jgi:hypothetical protein
VGIIQTDILYFPASTGESDVAGVEYDQSVQAPDVRTLSHAWSFEQPMQVE